MCNIGISLGIDNITAELKIKWIKAAVERKERDRSTIFAWGNNYYSQKYQAWGLLLAQISKAQIMYLQHPGFKQILICNAILSPISLVPFLFALLLTLSNKCKKDLKQTERKEVHFSELMNDTILYFLVSPS